MKTMILPGLLLLVITATLLLLQPSPHSKTSHGAAQEKPHNHTHTHEGSEVPANGHLSEENGTAHLHTKSATPARTQSLTGRHALGDELRAVYTADGEVSTSALQLVKTRMWNRRMDVLEAMQTEDDPSIVMMLAMILAENPAALADARVVQGLRDMVGHSVPEKRQAALAALSFIETANADLIDEVTAISRQDPYPQVRISAIATVSIWMEKQPGLIENLSREMIRTAQQNPDATVRGNAIQLVANQNVKMPDDIVQALVHYLQHEQVAENRQLAALGVGAATGTIAPEALSALEAAYRNETHQDTKRVILMQIVRSAGSDAPSVLAHLPAGNSVLASDVKDYLELLAAGVRDTDAIWTQKSIRDAERGH